MSLACVGSTRSVPATLGLPPLTGVSFPRLHCSGCRFLYRLWALGCVRLPGPNISGSGSQVLHKDADLVGPSFCAFPGEQLREPGAWWAHSPQVQCDFSPPWPRLFLGTLCLFWGADLWLRPSRQMSAIQNLRKSLVRNWKPVCSLVEDDASGVEFASFWLWLAPTSPLPPVGMGWSAANKDMATHFSFCAWEIPWAKHPVRLQSMEFQRHGHYWATEHAHSLDQCMHVCIFRHVIECSWNYCLRNWEDVKISSRLEWKSNLQYVDRVE